MDKKFKEQFIQNIINERAIDPNSDFGKILQSLVNEQVSDDVFVAKVVNELSLYDNKYLFNNEQITFGGQKGTTRQVIINSKDRKRIYDEMITLDQLYRPPKDGVDYR